MRLKSGSHGKDWTWLQTDLYLGSGEGGKCPAKDGRENLRVCRTRSQQPLAVLLGTARVVWFEQGS